VLTRRSARKATPAVQVEQLLVQQQELGRQNEELLRLGSELESARDRFVELFELAPIPYLTVDEAGLILEINQTGVEFLRRDRESLEGRPLALVISAARRAALRQFLIACRRGAVQAPFETELSSDPPRAVEVLARRAEGQKLYLALVDLAGLRRAERERRALQEQAEAAHSIAVSRVRSLAALSHELRTPLTPVLAAISALRRPGLPDDVHRLLALVERCVEHEVRLIDDLLDVARLTHGKMTFDSKVMDLHAAALEALELVMPELERKELRVHKQLRAREHHVRGDQVRLRQVFANLLRNACKFTPSGGSISLVSRSSRQGVVVEVSDTGVGILPGRLSVIFERFTQADGAEGQGGLGLGLAIARAIIEGHRGRISVASAGPGQGATFEIELACVPAPAAATAARPKRPASNGRSGRGERILLVEDHEDTALVLTELLDAEGYRIERARSVSEAVEKASPATQLVISDIGLPDGSGLEVMRRLRERRLKMPGIALSGYGTREDRKRSRAAGFTRHLVKPVRFEELVAAIREVRG
jgi:signal transduction histidine kinase